MRTAARIGVALTAPLLGIIGTTGAMATGFGGTPAGATVLTVPSAAGTYNGTFDFSGGSALKGVVVLKATGAFSISGGGPKGKWSQKGMQVTLSGKDGAETYVFIAPLTTKGLGSKASPGTFTANSEAAGTWYAVVKS